MSDGTGCDDPPGPAVARRDVLAGTGALAIGAIAGCSQSDNSADDTEEQPTETSSPQATSAGTTTVGTSCDSPTTLSPSDVEGGGTVSAGCYRAEKTLTVGSGTLTLEPGVVIQFTQNRGLEIEGDGRIRASGTAEAPVVLTGTEADRGFWKGLRIENSNSTDNRLEHTVVEYAGASAWNPNYDPAGIFVRGDITTLSLRRSTIRGNATMGLTVTQSGADLALERVSFEDNEAPLYIPANHVGSIGSGTAFEGNDEGFVYLGEPSGAGGTTVADAASWPALAVPYRPRIDVEVEAPVEVTPGATFLFEQNQGMQIRGEGRLTADAGGGDPITFSGTEDITGFWKGLFFSNSLSSDNVLRNTVIENGGSTETEGGGANDVANLYLDGGGRAAGVAVSDSTVRGSGGYGIAIRNSDARLLACDGLAFENNAGADTYNLESKTAITACQ
jgi:hypothetical protein